MEEKAPIKDKPWVSVAAEEAHGRWQHLRECDKEVVRMLQKVTITKTVRVRLLEPNRNKEAALEATLEETFRDACIQFIRIQGFLSLRFLSLR